MNGIRAAVARAAGSVAGVPALFGRAAGRLTIFNYHEVTDEPSMFSREYGLNVPPRTFARQLAWISRYFVPVSARQVMAGDLPPRAALVTFDDGFASTFEEGLPILDARGIPSLVFVNGAAVEGEVLWAGLVAWLHKSSARLQSLAASRQRHGVPLPPQLLLTRAEVDAEVERAGRAGTLAAASAYTGRMASLESLALSSERGAMLGNHLDNHYNAATLSADDLRDSFLRNASILGRFGHYVPLFSYPFGQPGTCYTQGTHRVLREAGAHRVFGAWALPNRVADAFLLHRATLDESVETVSAFRFEAVVRPWINARAAARGSHLRDAVDGGTVTRPLEKP